MRVWRWPSGYSRMFAPSVSARVVTPPRSSPQHDALAYPPRTPPSLQTGNKLTDPTLHVAKHVTDPALIIARA